MTSINEIKSGDYSLSLNYHVFDEVPEGATCLDVGCWIGNLGQALIEKKNCSVDGIDFNTDVLEQAKSKGYTNTYNINFNNDSFDLSQLEKKYDVIIFADVLEHLINPKQVLTYLKNYLKPGGKVIISLPNVAFLLNRILLLLGNWDYKEFGTLDKTHVKFFTIKTGASMVTSSGFKIIKLKPYNQFGILNHIKPLDSIFPGALCYQFLIVATPNQD